MTDRLIAELRAALSWELAKPAANPAFQALLELKREKDPTFINPLGIHGKHSELFVDQKSDRNT